MADDQNVRSVALPPGVDPPIEVYVNGERWSEGDDYSLERRTVRFHRPLRPQPPLGMGRKIMLAIGIGVYGDLRGDQLDIGYRSGGEARVISVPLSAVAAPRRGA